MLEIPRKARLFVAATLALAWLSFGLVLAGSDALDLGPRPVACAVLALLTFLGELRPITIARGDTQDDITVSTTFVMALIFIGPLWMAIAVLGAAVAFEDLRSRKGLVRAGFNAAQYALALMGARAVYSLVAGGPLLSGTSFDIPGDLPAALCAGAAFFIVNNTLAGSAAALAGEQPVWPHLRSDARFQLATSGVLLGFAPVVAASTELSLWLLPMLVMPIIAIHRSAELATKREHEALHDGLTGLGNRALFRLRAARACEQADRSKDRLGVMLLDLDHFKEINDTLGHHVGDDLLRVVGERLEASIRPGDTVARLGGDEFVLLLPGLGNAEQALVLAGRVLETLEALFEIDGVRLEVGASLGIALYPEHGTDVDLLLQRADIALYAAKVDRGRYKLYEAADDVHTPERLTLAAELRAGLDRGELFLQHQPKLNLGSGEVIGLESLVRWRHPTRGVLMPDQFLPVVENTGLITPLTLTVLDMALAAASRWRAAGHDLSVAVNLSVRHLTDGGLPSQVADALRRHRVPAHALVLEVTETLIMNDPARATEVLRQLRELGVLLAVDDFGTGYSSLAYLRRLNVHELKIDRSFVSHITSDAGDAVIVRSTIEMGRNLGLRLVAEGVEDQQTVEVLRSWGCDFVQGYHVSRPLDDAAVLPWLAGRLTRRLAAVPAASPPVPVQAPAYRPLSTGAPTC